MTGSSSAGEGTAEEVLRRFQHLLREQAEAKPFAAAFAPVENNAAAATAPLSPSGASRRMMRGLEESWGASAMQQGRWLAELLAGSAAWEIIERPPSGKKRRDSLVLPRVGEISHCEPVLRVMRESGELARRETLLQERDEALRTTNRDTAPEAERQQALREIYDRYFAEVSKLATEYRPLYQEMRRALGTIPALTGPRIRSHPLLQPPLMTRLFAACHADATVFFANQTESSFVASEYRSGRQAVTIRTVPDALILLDEMTWDIAAIAVCAFFARTTGRDPSAHYPFLIDDYFDWRGVDSRKRTREARQQIDARLQLLCSRERLHFDTQTELWLSEEANGEAPYRRRLRTAITTQGAFLTHRSRLFRPLPWVSEAENEPLYGYLISLGEWAHPFIKQGAMVGVFPKKLAEYDLRRQQWERQIGWYLVFQMQNQGAKMTFHTEETTAGSVQKAPLRVTPQHSLKMKTVLENSYIPWEEMARTNPGKVVRQWADALETLRRDGILGDYSCLDGAANGSDLPTRNRLGSMLNHRYLFTPGGDLAERLHRKAARRALV